MALFGRPKDPLCPNRPTLTAKAWWKNPNHNDHHSPTTYNLKNMKLKKIIPMLFLLKRKKKTKQSQKFWILFIFLILTAFSFYTFNLTLPIYLTIYIYIYMFLPIPKLNTRIWTNNIRCNFITNVNSSIMESIKLFKLIKSSQCTKPKFHSLHAHLQSTT